MVLCDAPGAAHRSCRAGSDAIDELAERLRALRAQIDEELRACGRAPHAVTVVGIGKTQSAARLAAAVDAGLGDIGENYVQEAQEKFESLPPVRKHFVGHLQTNKAKAVAALFDVVQSVDRLDAGKALDKAAAGLGRVVPVLLQINVSAAERFGCPPQEAERLAAALRALPSLRLDGLMAIGPPRADRDAIARAFELAAKTFARVGGSTLSLGMSEDWRDAVRAGSTMIRLGTALFGPRAPRDERKLR